MYVYIYIYSCSHFVRRSIQQCSMRNTHHLQLQNSFCGSWLFHAKELTSLQGAIWLYTNPIFKNFGWEKASIFWPKCDTLKVHLVPQKNGSVTSSFGSAPGGAVDNILTSMMAYGSKQWPESLIFLPVLLVLSHTCSNEWPINFQNSQGINDEACPRLKNVIEYLSNPTWTGLNATCQELVKQLPEGRIRGETSWPGYWQRNVEYMIWLRHESWFDTHIQLVCTSFQSSKLLC